MMFILHYTYGWTVVIEVGILVALHSDNESGFVLSPI